MSSLRLYLKNLLKKKLSISFRNKINIRPVKINLNDFSKNYSISDNFIWRTDNDFRTIFKFTNLLKFFYNENISLVDIFFYSNESKLIKEINNIDINELNSLIIDKDFMNGIEGFGEFNIFHKSKKENNFSIRNSCYTGFSYKKRQYSYVHGNIPVAKRKMISNNNQILNNEIIGSSALKNKYYIIQNDFSDYLKSEIFLTNPLNCRLNLRINGTEYSLNEKCSDIFTLEKPKVIKIISNSYLCRPIIFTYTKSSVDVMHG